MDHDLSRQNSVDLDTGFPHVSSEGEGKMEETEGRVELSSYCWFMFLFRIRIHFIAR